jgi:opacity protein-like surface antigen
MNTLECFRSSAATCLIVAWTSFAAADGPTLYVGASGGVSDLDIKSENAMRGDFNDIDDSSSGWKVHVGLMAPFENESIRGSFALEFSYIDLGEAKATITPLAPASPSQFTADFEAYGASAIIGIGIWKGLSLHGKIGWFFGETDSDPGGQPGIAFTDFDNEEGDDGVHYGIGLTYAVTEHLDLRMDWDRYDIFNIRIFGTGEDSDPDFFSVGFQYRF